MKNFIEKYLVKDKELKILDIGSLDVNGSYYELFNNDNWSYKGLDLEPGKNVDIVIKDIYNWTEIDSDSIDIVISGQAFEHIEYPWQTMKEIYRILKNNGLCCIIAPSEGPEHKHPVDCWRFLPDGLKALAKYADLEIIDSYYSESSKDETWKDVVLICKKQA